MAGCSRVLIPLTAYLLLILLATPPQANGAYIITTPRQWISQGTSQVCVFVTDAEAPAGSLSVKVTVYDSNLLPEERNQTIVEKVFELPAGKYDQCHEVEIPKIDSNSVNLLLTGSVSGVKINDMKSINLIKNKVRTYVQTDKYLYRPGEQVQLRVLTVTGNKLEVFTEPYPEIWVTTPSRTRIAQWKNVSNSEGLVHLGFQLADEPEEGEYTLHVETPEERTTQSFKVEEFVLPRYEVTVTPPKYILATDEKFTFTVCANYTFGQPVKGNLSFTINNQQSMYCYVTQTTNTTIDGCTDVVVSASDMQINDCHVYSLSVLAVVEEEGTGVELRDIESVSITRNSVNFKTLYKDEFMKPNLPLSIKVRAELPDGSPAVGVPVEVCAAGRCNNDTTSTNGIFNIVLPSYNSKSIIVKALNSRANMNPSEFRDNINRYYSPSNSSLLIVASENKLECPPKAPTKHLLPIMFSARDQPSATLAVQVVSRGHIQHMATQEVTLTASELPINAAQLVEPMPPPIEGTVRGVVNLEVTLPPTASPKASILVWYTRNDGEVVSDVRELEVERCLANNVTLGWSTPKAQPGEAASLSLSSEPNSVCSLGVVDRSTELLAQEPDPITLERLFDFLESFTISKGMDPQMNDNEYCRKRRPVKPLTELDGYTSTFSPYSSYYTSYVDALKMFSDAGVYVITDLTVETRPCELREYPGLTSTTSPIFTTSVLPGFTSTTSPIFTTSVSPTTTPDGAVDVPGSGTSVTSPRTKFPETWLWDLLVVPANGTHEQQVTLPDTITQWVGKAVCVHPQAGVGLSSRQPIITFTPFFVDPTLPPTVKRGEILPIKMSVFNYHNQPLPVSLTLEDSVEYEILEEAGYLGVRGKRSACVPPNDKAVLTVRVRPQKTADVKLTISAAVDPTEMQSCGAGVNSPQRSDALIRSIKVEAEGFLREKTWTKYICSKEFQTGEDSLEPWELTLPQTMVEGSARGWVTAVGDLLALSLENLGHLIRMPYGCGEQNMINFAPNIYIMQYLRTTRQATPEATAKLLRHMNTGYQRQLLYRRDNRSFSAFGNADGSGSTWLTAFVLKSFAQADEYIQIDETKLNETRRWLMGQQGKDGCFISVGKVLQKSMQGGVSTSKTPAPLTAYVLAALLEAGEKPTAPPLQLAVKCLKSVSSTHPYTLALKAYSLALAHHPEAATAVMELLQAAVDLTNVTYWKLPEGPGDSLSAAVEVAGYAILAMMEYDPVTYEPQARKVVKWITSERNGQGGFYSTQDTVVALQALATYESHQHQEPLSVFASVTAEGLTHTFSVTDNNKLLQQLVTLPTLPTNVTLGMTGEGCAVLQAVLRYNIPSPEPSDAFDLTINTITVPDRMCATKRITACTSYRLPDASNMVVMEVDLISGYVPEKDDLKQLMKNDSNLKRYEVDGSKINFYINELTGKDTCVNFRVTRTVDVEEVKAGTVVVYDYYQQKFSISKRYTLPPNDECR